MKQWRLGLLGVVVSILAIYFIVHQIDVSALIRALAGANYIYILPTFLLLLAGLLTRAVRWHFLLNRTLPLARAFSILNVSYLVNGILPLRMGEVARMYLATRADPPVPALKSASTIIVERLLDLLAVLVLLALALASGSLPVELRTAATLSVPITLVGFLGLVFLSSQHLLVKRMAARLIDGRHPTTSQKLLKWLDHFLDGLKPLTQPRALGQALLWTAVSWGFSTVAGYILMLGFFPTANWTATFLYIAAASFAIAVPAVPGSIGPYEMSILLALGAVGYGEPRDTAVAFALVVHGVNLGLYAVAGLVGFVQEGISLSQLSQGVREMRQSQLVTQDVGSSE